METLWQDGALPNAFSVNLDVHRTTFTPYGRGLQLVEKTEVFQERCWCGPRADREAPSDLRLLDPGRVSPRCRSMPCMAPKPAAVYHERTAGRRVPGCDVLGLKSTPQPTPLPRPAAV